jgi:hypothetical protein
VSTEGSGGDGRAAHVIAQLYYYVAAVIGVGLLLGGLIVSLLAVRTLALPREFDSSREAVRNILHGLAFAIPGAAVLWWHLREASRREVGRRAAAFWGKALYYHLVALVALGFVLGGSVKVLLSAGDAAVPACYGVFAEPVPGFKQGPLVGELHSPACDDRSEAERGVLDGLIVLVVSGPLFVWHLRQGRKVTGFEEAPEPGSPG